MAHPVCGQCHSLGVYLERNTLGDDYIVCTMCGNRYPGGKGFYMSDKALLKNHLTIIPSEGIAMEESLRIENEGRLCVECKSKRTISDSSPYCASCMAGKRRKKGRQRAAKPPGKLKAKKMKKDICHTEKSANRGNMEVVVNFKAYPSILAQVKALAEDQIRPVEAQIIFLLKSHFANAN